MTTATPPPRIKTRFELVTVLTTMGIRVHASGEHVRASGGRRHIFDFYTEAADGREDELHGVEMHI